MVAHLGAISRNWGKCFLGFCRWRLFTLLNLYSKAHLKLCGSSLPLFFIAMCQNNRLTQVFDCISVSVWSSASSEWHDRMHERRRWRRRRRREWMVVVTRCSLAAIDFVELLRDVTIARSLGQLRWANPNDRRKRWVRTRVFDHNFAVLSDFNTIHSITHAPF